jgi:hypothetical protein
MVGAAVNYEVRRSSAIINDDNDCSNAALVPNAVPQTNAGTGVSFEVFGLTGLSRYFFCVRAYDDAGNASRWTGGPVWTDTPRGNQSPSAAIADQPGFLMTTVALTLDGTGSIDPDAVVCSAVSANYRYEWRLTAQPAASTLATADIVNANQVTASFTPDEPGTYTFELMFIDDPGTCSDGPRGAIASRSFNIILADFTPPSVPGFPGIGSITTNSVTLNWDAAGDDGLTGQASGRYISISTAPMTTAADCAAAPRIITDARLVNPTQLMFFNVTGLSQNTLYYFCIRAYDEVNNLSGPAIISRSTLEDIQGWGGWANVGGCSANCGGGNQLQQRPCVNPTLGCSGPASRTVSCNTQPCHVYSASSQFGGTFHSANCNPGYRVQSVSCHAGRTAFEQFDWFPDPFACGALGRGGNYKPGPVVTGTSGIGGSTANCSTNASVPQPLDKCQNLIDFNGRAVSPWPHIDPPGFFKSDYHVLNYTCEQIP